MTDSYRDLHGDAYKEWRENRADEFVGIQRDAFLAGFEAAASESKTFNLLREWVEEERDDRREQYKQTDEAGYEGEYFAYVNVLVKLSEMGCGTEVNDYD